MCIIFSFLCHACKSRCLHIAISYRWLHLIDQNNTSFFLLIFNGFVFQAKIPMEPFLLLNVEVQLCLLPNICEKSFKKTVIKRLRKSPLNNQKEFTLLLIFQTWKSIFLHSKTNIMFQHLFKIFNELGGFIFYNQTFRKLLLQM